jgi:hypothetical protein
MVKDPATTSSITTAKPRALSERCGLSTAEKIGEPFPGSEKLPEAIAR